MHHIGYYLLKHFHIQRLNTHLSIHFTKVPILISICEWHVGMHNMQLLLPKCMHIIANFVLGEKEVSFAKNFYARNRCSKQEICSEG